MKKIIEFWKQAKEQDPLCFWLEMLGTLVTIGASMTLAITAVDPDMRYIYPGYFVGSLTATYAHYRRKLAWPTLLVGYFCFVNFYGWLVAMRIV